MIESRSHARLGPSAAHRWLACPASVLLCESLEITGADTGSVYAAEGTAAHSIAEIVASEAFGMMSGAMVTAALAAWRGSYSDAPWIPEGETISDVQDEMVEHARMYVGVLRKYVTASSVIRLEQRVSPGVEHVWGTADATISDTDVLTVVDYKYGKGVRVDAMSNEQLMFYALGAWEADLMGTASLVRIVVVQPRLDHVSVWEIETHELLNWRDEVARPGAARVLEPDAPFGPSEEACRFCPARGQCKAQMEWSVRRDFGSDDESLGLMDGDDFAEAMRLAPVIRAWLTAVEEKALTRVYADHEEIPGWKVVQSGGTRKITDTDDAIGKLEAAGLDRRQFLRPVVPQLQTLAVLDKLCGRGKTGRDRLQHLLGDTLGVTEGRPSLVPADDPRPPVSNVDSAVLDFADPDD
jgi:hypothetical protein